MQKLTCSHISSTRWVRSYSYDKSFARTLEPKTVVKGRRERESARCCVSSCSRCFLQSALLLCEPLGVLEAESAFLPSDVSNGERSVSAVESSSVARREAGGALRPAERSTRGPRRGVLLVRRQVRIAAFDDPKTVLARRGALRTPRPDQTVPRHTDAPRGQTATADASLRTLLGGLLRPCG